MTHELTKRSPNDLRSELFNVLLQYNTWTAHTLVEDILYGWGWRLLEKKQDFPSVHAHWLPRLPANALYNRIKLIDAPHERRQDENRILSRSEIWMEARIWVDKFTVLTFEEGIGESILAVQDWLQTCDLSEVMQSVPPNSTEYQTTSYCVWWWAVQLGVD